MEFLFRQVSHEVWLLALLSCCWWMEEFDEECDWEPTEGWGLGAGLLAHNSLLRGYHWKCFLPKRLNKPAGVKAKARVSLKTPWGGGVAPPPQSIHLPVFELTLLHPVETQTLSGTAGITLRKQKTSSWCDFIFKITLCSPVSFNVNYCCRTPVMIPQFCQELINGPTINGTNCFPSLTLKGQRSPPIERAGTVNDCGHHTPESKPY